MEYVKYNFGYMYSYSERPGTLAGRKMEDDVSRNQNELQEIVDLTKHAWLRSEQFIGQIVEVLVEKFQKNLLKNFLGDSKHYRSFQRKL
jgi:tRNA-2-methylthio-N6-dimethylallyladenosine synthase